MSVMVFRDNTVFVNEVFPIGRALFSIFSRELVQLPLSTAYICKLVSHNNKFDSLVHKRLLIRVLTQSLN